MKTASETNSEITVTHTPTPWHVERSEDGEDLFIVSDTENPERDGYCLIADMVRGGYSYEELGYTNAANAAHIVRCVNTMPAMLELLEDCSNAFSDIDGLAVAHAKGGLGQAQRHARAMISRIDTVIKGTKE
jgi:hypothetical protein